MAVTKNLFRRVFSPLRKINIPQNDIVASLDLSSGGAQCRQIPWHAGYVTP